MEPVKVPDGPSVCWSDQYRHRQWRMRDIGRSYCCCGVEMMALLE